MANFKETGVKISQFPIASVNATSHKGRLQQNHYLISQAPTHYGLGTINKNFQIPLHALRADLIGFIGTENMKGKYQERLSFWYGDWADINDKTNSYVYQWDQQKEYLQKDFIKNKHGKNVQYDKERNINRIFILKDAPIPLESTYTPINGITSKTYGEDPNPKSVKIVDKSYVDDRHNGYRQIEKSNNTPEEESEFGSILEIRPYTCFYQYSLPPSKSTITGVPTINICDTQIMEDGRTIRDHLKNSHLTFYIRLTNNEIYHTVNRKHKCNLAFLLNGQKKIDWTYTDELIEIVRQNRPNMDENGQMVNVATGYIFIRCDASYEYNETTKEYDFKVICSNFFGRDKKSKRIVKIGWDNPFIEAPREINIDLSLHEYETFVTQIEYHDQLPTPNYHIKFDASGLNDNHEHSWDYFIITPDEKLKVEVDGSFSNKHYDNIIFEDSATTSIMWANSDAYNITPNLQPNKIYCFEFVKVFDNIIIGRIKYYINLIKKS